MSHPQEKNQVKLAVICLETLSHALWTRPSLRSIEVALPHWEIMVVANEKGEGAFPDFGVVQLNSSEDLADVKRILEDWGVDKVMVYSSSNLAYQLAIELDVEQKVGFCPGWSQPLKQAWLSWKFAGKLEQNSEKWQSTHHVLRYQHLASLITNDAIVAPHDILFPVSIQSVEKVSDQIQFLGDVEIKPPTVFVMEPEWVSNGWQEKAMLQTWDVIEGDKFILCSERYKDWASQLIGEEKLLVVETISQAVESLRLCRMVVAHEGIWNPVVSIAKCPSLIIYDETDHVDRKIARNRPWHASNSSLVRPHYSESAVADYILDFKACHEKALGDTAKRSDRVAAYKSGES